MLFSRTISAPTHTHTHTHTNTHTHTATHRLAKGQSIIHIVQIECRSVTQHGGENTMALHLHRSLILLLPPLFTSLFFCSLSLSSNLRLFLFPSFLPQPPSICIYVLVLTHFLVHLIISFFLISAGTLHHFSSLGRVLVTTSILGSSFRLRTNHLHQLLLSTFPKLYQLSIYSLRNVGYS